MNKISYLLLLLVAGVIGYLFGAYQINSAQKITNKDIMHAEKLIGIDYTKSEIDSMFDNLDALRENYIAIRNLHIANNIWPAVQFNPIPVGFEFEKEQKPIFWSKYKVLDIPKNLEDIAYYSIGQLAELLKSQKITSLALTKMYIERIKKYDPKLFSVITLTEELALEQAKNADAEIAAGKYIGPLHGIPFGVKDLLSTKKYKTTFGAMPYKDQFIDTDATVVKKLVEAGAVLVAKLSLGALAMDDVWFGGKTRNPWDTNIGSSGSSAGPASAVSAGLLPFAIGSETWGSIVSPSNRCGVTGLRPTYGRVSRHGAMALSWTMDKLGPICRNVEDCAIVFDAIYGPDGLDQTLYDVPFNYQPLPNLKGLKIGYLKEDIDHDTVNKKFNDFTLKKLEELGSTLIPIELPKLPVRDISFILEAESGAAFEDLTLSNKDDMLVLQSKDAWPNIFRYSRFIPAVEYIQANRMRYLLIQEMAKIMKNIDLYISPSRSGDNLLLTNLTGHPCVVLPNGFISPTQPTSITFIGQLFDEGKLLAVAKTYQDATNFHLKHPKIK